MDEQETKIDKSELSLSEKLGLIPVRKLNFSDVENIPKEKLDSVFYLGPEQKPKPVSEKIAHYVVLPSLIIVGTGGYIAFHVVTGVCYVTGIGISSFLVGASFGTGLRLGFEKTSRILKSIVKYK